MPTNHDQEVISSGTQTAKRGGCHELEFSGDHVVTAKVPALPLNITYTLPSGARIAAKAFARADGKAVSRCYLAESGEWSWEAKSSAGKGVASGTLLVEDSKLPGKLRVSAKDTRQFVTDSGTFFLHLGDTAETLLTISEPTWKAYIDQAAQAGFTKIRVRLTESPDSTANFYDSNRRSLNFPFFDQVEERLSYALGRYPHIQFQVDLFAHDRDELERFEEGDPATHLFVQYVAERFSPLPNVHWYLASEIDPAKDSAVTLQAISRLGKSVFEQSPWHSLITCGQPRFANFLFDREKWCGYASLKNLGQVDGSYTLANKALTQKPMVLDADRSEYDQAPLLPRYYFRRLFWGVILSGGHATYHGMNSSGLGSGHRAGIVPYYDSCHSGRLKMGAHDIAHITAFLKATDTSLEGWISDDAITGNKPLQTKAMRSSTSDTCIVYIANPDLYEGHTGKDGEGFYTDERASASDIFTTFNLELPFSMGIAKWFNPSTGEWKGQVDITKASTIFLTPEPGDWVLWIQKDKTA